MGVTFFKYATKRTITVAFKPPQQFNSIQLTLATGQVVYWKISFRLETKDLLFAKRRKNNKHHRRKVQNL